jgi:hypothetical protein
MPLRTKIVALVVSIGLLLFIVELVRRRKLREEYSQVWFATGAIVLVLAIWFDLLKWFSHVIGAVSHVSTIFFLAFLFLVLISLNFSVVISKLTDRVKDLAQQQALLKAEIEALKREQEEDGGAPGNR